MNNTNEGIMPISNPLTLGVDLGTTNSCASIYINGQTIVLDMEQSAQKTIPSIVRFIDRKLEDTIIGSAAKKYKIIKPNEVFSSVKSLMQDESWRNNEDLVAKYTFDGVVLTPKDIAQKILEEVLRLAQKSEYGQNGTFDKVVICVPANSTPQYKNYVKDIAKAVGFGKKDGEGNYILKPDGDIMGIDILSEPSAAAISYAKEKGIFDSNKDKEINLLVYDFGGGTFDVTILTVRSKSTGVPAFDIKGTYGVPNLGGDDIDKVLMQYVSDQFYDETGIDLMDPSKDNKGNSPKAIYQAQAWLKNESERAKIEFSNESLTEYTFDNPGIIDDNDEDKTCNLNCIVSREQFECIIAPLIQRTIECVEGALASSKLSFDEIDRFIIVGGSSKGPWVRNAIKNKFGREPYNADNLDTIVSRGAAIYGEEKRESVITTPLGQPTGNVGGSDSTPETENNGGGLTLVEKTVQSIGVELKNGFFSPLTEKGITITESIPCEGRGKYTNADSSNTITIALWGTSRNLEIETTPSGNKVVYDPIHGIDENGNPLFDYYGEVSIDVPQATPGTVDIQLVLEVRLDNSLKITAIVDGGEPQVKEINNKK